MQSILVPIKTVSGMNVREHWGARSKRVGRERDAVGMMLTQLQKPELPCVVRLTRIGPSNGLDPFDNLPSALKPAVDAVAAWLGVDDRKSELVRYECAQRRGESWAVLIELCGKYHAPKGKS